MCKAQVLTEALKTEFQTVAVSRLKDMVKDGAIVKNGESVKTIDISSSSIMIKAEPSGITSVTVLDRPKGFPYKPGAGITFFLGDDDEDHRASRVARDILYWMSLHSSGFRGKVDLHQLTIAYGEDDSPALRHEQWRTHRQIPQYC